MLGVAAAHADIISITANLRSGEVGVDAIADSMPSAYDAKVARLREAASDRIDDLELSSLTMNTTITDDRDGTLAFSRGNVRCLGPLMSPIRRHCWRVRFRQIVETLQQRRERWGFNYVVVQQDGGQGMDQFPKVIAALAGT